MKCDWCPEDARYIAVLGWRGAAVAEIWDLRLCETHAKVLNSTTSGELHFPDRNGIMQLAQDWVVGEL